MHRIDRFLNGITMYHLTLRGLWILAGISVVFGAFGILSYDAVRLLLSFFILAVACFTSNALFAKLFKAAPSVESSSISAFILFFLLMPPTSVRDGLILACAGVVAMASKYVLAIRGRHVFNPAAVGALFSGIVFGAGAIWWIATPPLLPFVLVFGLLVVRKIRRIALFVTSVVCAVVTLVVLTISQGLIANSPSDILNFVQLVFISWPILFFASIMLTEPATTPPTRGKRIMYGAIAGVLFGLPVHVGTVYMSPELALLLANIFSYIVGAKDRLQLTLVERMTTARDTYHFSFSSPRSLSFAAGQYLEWTLPHKKPDNRGNRRYFTIASSPTEKTIGLGVKIAEKSSSFKQALKALKPGDTITVSQRSGDFTLPKDTHKKLVFIAGGIGITPFRSMTTWLMDTKEQRDVVLLYAAATPEDFAYTDLFKKAETTGMRTILVPKNAPESWKGPRGLVTADLITQEVPDYRDRHFYLSGPGAMVDASKALLRSMGISPRNITTDYFPGL